MRRALGLLLISTATAAPWPVLAAAWAPPEAPPTMSVNLPLRFDGHYEGDIGARLTVDGATVELDSKRLLALLGERLSDRHRTALDINSGAFVSLEQLREAGIDATYNPETLEIAVSIPVERQGAQGIAAQEARKPPEASIAEAPFAATATVQVQQRYHWRTSNNRGRMDPLEAGVDFSASWGAPGQLEFFSQVDYRGGRGGGFERGATVAFHDDLKRAIRYSAGDVAPQIAGYQTSPLIGGLSVERQYGVIQPYRNVRPSGQFGFILERESTVDVVVNGSVLRTLKLNPGQYNLSDFPFFNGLNNVELYVVDGSGRRLLAQFSQYFSARLLQRGIFEFGATGGVLQDNGGQQRNRSRYLFDRPAFSGYTRYGLSETVTAGANIQAASRQYMLGAEAALASPIGTFVGVASASGHRSRGRGYAALVGYEGSARELGFLVRPQLNLELQVISKNFAPLQLVPQENRYRSIAQGRFVTQLPGQVSLGVSAARYSGRDSEPDQERYAVTVGRRFGPVSATLAGERIDTRGPQRQSHVLLTLTMPFGHRGAMRSTFDTRGRRAAVEYSRFQPDEINTFGLRAAMSRGDEGVEGSGEFSFFHNRFAAIAQHSLVADRDLRRIGRQQTSLTVSSQIAYAGGRVAVGRPVGPRFMIVSAHRSLENAVVSVRQGAGRAKPQAAAGTFGPALAPAGSSYTAGDIRVDVDNAPPGYDVGTSQFTTVPSAAAGYAVTVGSDRSRTLLGIALGPDGQPLGLLGGELRLTNSTADVEPVLFFTNRAGRFAGNGLGPGRYELILGTERKFRAEISIPERSIGIVDIGNLKFTEAQP